MTRRHIPKAVKEQLVVMSGNLKSSGIARVTHISKRTVLRADSLTVGDVAHDRGFGRVNRGLLKGEPDLRVEGGGYRLRVVKAKAPQD